MPYPSLIDHGRIIAAARELIESKGIENVSLHMVANALRVKAPSLYRYFKNKNALLLAVNEITITELYTAMINAVDCAESLIEQLIVIAKAYRQYAHKHPVYYEVAMSSNPELKPAMELQIQLILPLQKLLAQHTSEADSLAALRGVYAFLHGWVSLEVAQQLRRGGDLNIHFEQSLRALLASWTRTIPEIH